jgi:hypothetical protein
MSWLFTPSSTIIYNAHAFTNLNTSAFNGDELSMTVVTVSNFVSNTKKYELSDWTHPVKFWLTKEVFLFKELMGIYSMCSMMMRLS